MTRREFIERCAIAGFGGAVATHPPEGVHANEVAIVQDAIRLANEIESRAGGEWSAEGVATLADRLHELDRSVEWLGNLLDARLT